MNKRGFLKTISAFVALATTGIPFVFPKLRSAETPRHLTLTEQLKRDLENSLQNFIFEPNDEITRNIINQTCSDVLERHREKKSIYNFSVSSYSRFDKNLIDVNIIFQPARSIEYVIIDVVIAPIS